MRFDQNPTLSMNYEDAGGFDTSGDYSAPSGLDALTPEVKQVQYDESAITPDQPQNKFGGSFDNLIPSTPQYNAIGDPSVGTDPNFNPYNLGFAVDRAMPDISQYDLEEVGGALPSFRARQSAQPAQPATPNYIDTLSQQILGQGTSGKWSGQGYGSAEANARDMAKILSGIGITDISQFGKVPQYTTQQTYQGQPVQTDENGNSFITVPSGGTDEYGNPEMVRQNVDPNQVTTQKIQTGEAFGNKATGQVVPNTYSERQTGNFWGGTFQGKGNTGYGVQFDEKGNPYFYTQGASSSDIGKLAPLLAIAQFVPGLQPFAMAANAAIAASQGNVLGALAGAAGLGGYSDIASAANFANAAKSGNPLAIISSGANLGGTDLSGVADAVGAGDLNNIGGYNVNDAVRAYNAAKALKSGDAASIISSLGGYAVGAGQPTDTYTPIPSNGSSTFSGLEEPTDRAIATRPIESTIGAPSGEIPSIGANPIDLPELPKAPEQTPDLSEKSFKSAFAQARASGDKEFLWNGNVYNTNLAPNKPTTYDSVGGGRGGQGGPTAEELARYNAVSGNTPSNSWANWASSMIPSAQAGTVSGVKAPDISSQIPGYSGSVPAPTYDQNNSIAGRIADELGLPQEFQRNLSNTLNALPGVNLPFGAAGKFVGAAEEAAGSKYFDAAGRYIPGSNAYQAPEYASEATRLTADPMKMFKMIQDLPNDVYRTTAVQDALKAISSGDSVAAYRALESNPSAKRALLEYGQKLGAQEVSPFQNIRLFNPPENRLPTTRRAMGGLATFDGSDGR